MIQILFKSRQIGNIDPSFTSLRRWSTETLKLSVVAEPGLNATSLSASLALNCWGSIYDLCHKQL